MAENEKCATCAQPLAAIRFRRAPDNAIICERCFTAGIERLCAAMDKMTGKRGGTFWAGRRDVARQGRAAVRALATERNRRDRDGNRTTDDAVPWSAD